MKRIVGLAFVGALGLFFANAFPQEPNSPPGTQKQRQEPADEDRVYSAKQVDKKAVITNRKDLDPERLGSAIDCPSGARVIIKAVLRRSGEVTDIKLKKSASCSLDEKAAKIIKSAKFSPAIKDGVVVSQYEEFTYELRKF